jgi:hypothetical protein
MGNRVVIERGPGANRKEGAYHSLARRENDSKRMVTGNAPRGLASRSPDIAGCGEEDRKGNIREEIGRNNMRDQREEIRKWPGLCGVLKRTVRWPSGQVWTGNAVSATSYVL